MFNFSRSNQNIAKPRSRAIAESVIVHHLVPILTNKLKMAGLFQSFEAIEMPTIISLVHMELNGFGFCQKECEKQRKVVVTRLNELEEQAYKLGMGFTKNVNNNNFCSLAF